jgi:hypothetical protein
MPFNPCHDCGTRHWVWDVFDGYNVCDAVEGGRYRPCYLNPAASAEPQWVWDVFDVYNVCDAVDGRGVGRPCHSIPAMAANPDPGCGMFLMLLMYVMQLREGGIDHAIRSLPRLRNQTLGHIFVHSAIHKPAFNATRQAVRKQSPSCLLAPIYGTGCMF